MRRSCCCCKRRSCGTGAFLWAELERGFGLRACGARRNKDKAKFKESWSVGLVTSGIQPGFKQGAARVSPEHNGSLGQAPAFQQLKSQDASLLAVQSWQRLCMSGWRELALEMTLEFLQHFEGTHREHIFLEMFKT